MDICPNNKITFYTSVPNQTILKLTRMEEKKVRRRAQNPGLSPFPRCIICIEGDRTFVPVDIFPKAKKWTSVPTTKYPFRHLSQIKLSSGHLSLDQTILLDIYPYGHLLKEHISLWTLEQWIFVPNYFQDWNQYTKLYITSLLIKCVNNFCISLLKK